MRGFNIDEIKDGNSGDLCIPSLNSSDDEQAKGDRTVASQPGKLANLMNQSNNPTTNMSQRAINNNPNQD